MASLKAGWWYKLLIPDKTTDFFRLAKSVMPTLHGVKQTSPDFVNINNAHNDHDELQVMPGTDEVENDVGGGSDFWLQ